MYIYIYISISTCNVNYSGANCWKQTNRKSCKIVSQSMVKSMINLYNPSLILFVPRYQSQTTQRNFSNCISPIDCWRIQKKNYPLISFSKNRRRKKGISWIILTIYYFLHIVAIKLSKPIRNNKTPKITRGKKNFSS